MQRPNKEGFMVLFDAAEAMVGLEKTFISVSESDGAVELCAVVYIPDETFDCPIDFPFGVSLSTSDHTTGRVL